MTIDISKPYIISLVFIPLLIVIGLFSKGKSIDIQLHDTYYVVENLSFAMLSSTILALIGLGYWTIIRFNGRLNHTFTGVHLTITIGFFLLVMLIAIIHNTQAYNSQNPDFSQWKLDYSKWIRVTKWLLVGVLLFILSQIVYVINLVVGLAKR